MVKGFESREHMLSVIRYGVYFGYSDMSIIQFVVEFDEPMFDCSGNVIDPKNQIRDYGDGMIPSYIEAKYNTKEQVYESIKNNRFCSLPFPITSTFDKDMMKKEIDTLLESNQTFIERVNKIVKHIDNCAAYM